MILGILHNGTMTTFELHTTHDGPIWHLCRDDIRRIAEGRLAFDDGRPAIDLDKADTNYVIEQARKIVDRIERNQLWPDDGGGYFDRFMASPGRFGRLATADLGRKFMFKGRPFVFLGARQRSQKLPIAARDLYTGRVIGFEVAVIENALHKAAAKSRHEMKVEGRSK